MVCSLFSAVCKQPINLQGGSFTQHHDLFMLFLAVHLQDYDVLRAWTFENWFQSASFWKLCYCLHVNNKNTNL